MLVDIGVCRRGRLYQYTRIVCEYPDLLFYSLATQVALRLYNLEYGSIVTIRKAVKQGGAGPIPILYTSVASV